jgi:hypothetical protein
MKSNDANLMVTRRVRQKGMITSSCGLALLLMALIVIAATPNLFVFVPATIQHVTVVVLGGQLVGWALSGRSENE